MKVTIFKGKVAEQKVILRAMEKGWIVSKPVCDCKYDLILDNENKFYKIQVKYADGKSSNSENCVVAQLRSRKGRNTNYRYEDGEIDAIIVYVPKLDKVLWFNKDRFIGKSALHIRIAPTKNGQKSKTNIAQELLW
jgi:Holliday junction resolvase-like predicted endonuclease